MAVFLVIVKDGADRKHAGVLLGLKIPALLGLVVVEDAADKGRNEGDLGVRASDGLVKVEEEREVARDALRKFEESAESGGGVRTREEC